MKFINCIFSIYLITLSCLPCADIDSTFSIHSSTEISSEEDNHSHEKSGDNCSPFCICNCCGNHNFVIFEVYHFFEYKNGIDTKLPEYKSLHASNFYGSIWQPPKINDVI